MWSKRSLCYLLMKKWGWHTHLWSGIIGYFCATVGIKTLVAWAPALAVSISSSGRRPGLLCFHCSYSSLYALSVRGKSCLGPGQPPATRYLLWVCGGQGCIAQWGRLSAWSQSLGPHSVHWLWTDTQEPLHRCVLLAVPEALWQEDGGVATRVFFHETYVLILQVSYLDENKSFWLCFPPVNIICSPPTSLLACLPFGNGGVSS